MTRNQKIQLTLFSMDIELANKTTTKNVFRIGKHSELLKEHKDPLAYANKVVEEFNSKLEENNKQIFTIAVDTAMKQAKQYKSSS